MALFQLDDIFGYQQANEIKRLWASDTAPANPGDGEIWLDISQTPNRLKRYTGGIWEIICDMTADNILDLLKTVDGSGSGLDADTLDAQEGSYYLNASNLNAGTIPLDRIPATLTGKDADTLDTVHASQFIRSDANDNVAGHTEWQDTYQARFGDAADLRIQHSGTASFIDNYNTDLYIRQLSHGDNIVFSAENDSGVLKTLLTLDPDKNIVEGRIARSALVELWRDTTSNEESSPYIQTGQASLPDRYENFITVPFDNAFTSTPRISVTMIGNVDIVVPEIESVSTTSISMRSSYASGNFDCNWIAIGKKT